MRDVLFESDLKSLPLVGRGKVRDIYAVGDDHLLIVTTDRLSAFDVVLPNEGASRVDTVGQALEALWRWLPFVVGQGFVLNLVVSFLTMLIGTIAGVLLGLGQISPLRPLARSCWFVTQLFRNSPWLVLLFIVMLALYSVFA